VQPPSHPRPEGDPAARPPVPVEAEFTLLRKHLKVRHRACERYRTRLATSGWLRVADGAESQFVWIRDLSLLGVGLVLAVRLEPGTSLAVRMRSTLQGRTVERPSRVVHCTQQADGEWIVGCEFASPLSPDELNDLL
jgi:hypothetical protein